MTTVSRPALLPLLLLLLSANHCARAQAVSFAGIWTLQSAADGPSGRYSAPTANDASGRVVLFGGINEHGALNDTWLWDGTSWKQQLPPKSPPARSNASMANDASGHIVLFGGFTESGDLHDTWTWDGSTWKQQFPASSPSARSDAAMANDASGNILLFGGFDGENALDDTWIWNGSTQTWTEASPAESPGGRYHASMANYAAGRVVLFGGLNENNRALNETWTWDGAAANWTQPSPESTPGARESASMASDRAGRVVLFGGYGGFGSTDLNDTWAWDGTNWTRQHSATSPTARTVALLACQGPGQLVLFSGLSDSVLNDIWFYQRTSVNFGNVRVGSRTLFTLAYDIHSAVRLADNVKMLNPNASSSDFSLSGKPTCTGSQASDSSCTVTIAFAPRAGGLRTSTVQLMDRSGTPLASTPLLGQGQGPAPAR